jgi:hypothetical protein
MPNIGMISLKGKVAGKLKDALLSDLASQKAEIEK